MDQKHMISQKKTKVQDHNLAKYHVYCVFKQERFLLIEFFAGPTINVKLMRDTQKNKVVRFETINVLN